MTLPSPLTLYICGSHICDKALIDHPHSNPHVSQCKTQGEKCHNSTCCDTYPCRCRIRL